MIAGIPGKNHHYLVYNLLFDPKKLQDLDDKELIKSLLIKQIESRVEWRKSINFMIKEGIKQFIEIGPGKVLSGLIKRIDRSLKVSTINKEEDIKLININD